MNVDWRTSVQFSCVLEPCVVVMACSPLLPLSKYYRITSKFNQFVPLLHLCPYFVIILFVWTSISTAPQQNAQVV